MASCLTYHYDPQRTGFLTEPSSADPATYRLLGKTRLGSAVRGAPLFIEGILIGRAQLDLVYLADSTNQVFAFDLAQLRAGVSNPKPVWQTELTVRPLTRTDSNIPPPIGISSTGVLDPDRGQFFLLATHDDGRGNPAFTFFALALDTGKIVAEARVSDPGAPCRPTFDPAQQDQRGALNLVGDHLYATFAAFKAYDEGAYRGWVVAANANNLRLQDFFPTTVHVLGGGAWGPGGPASPGPERLLIPTGNAPEGGAPPALTPAYPSTLSSGGAYIFGKAVLDERAVHGPALAALGDSELIVAWCGDDSDHHPNLKTSLDGQTFGPTVILGNEGSDHGGPGLTVGAGKVFLAWTGRDSDNSPNVAASPSTGALFAPGYQKVVIPFTSSQYGPALAFGDGLLFLAWTDSDDQIHVATLTPNLDLVDQISAGQTSDDGPGLCFADGHLFLVWRGSGNQNLNLMEITVAVAPPKLGTTAALSLSETSDYHPALAFWTDNCLFGVPDQFAFAWAGAEHNAHLNLLRGPSTTALGAKQTFGELTVAAPALASFRGNLCLAWSGTGGGIFGGQPHQVNVGTAAVLQAGTPPDNRDGYEAVLLLSTTPFHLFDYFLPKNFRALNTHDLDLGGSSVCVLPPRGTHHLAVTSGKDGVVYLLDVAKLGHLGGQLDRFQAFAPGMESKGAPAFFASSQDQFFVYVIGDGDAGDPLLVAFRIDFSAVTPKLVKIWEAAAARPQDSPGSPVVMSTLGAPFRHEAVVWVVEGPGSAVLHAFDALTGHERFNSRTRPGGPLGDVPHFAPITCAPNLVLVGTTEGFAYYGP